MTKHEHHNFISAAAAVYVWMSASDGVINKTEISGFIDYLYTLDYISEISDSEFEETYIKILTVFQNDYDKGVVEAKNRLKLFLADPIKSVDLIKTAREALIADGVFNEAEETVLKEIANFLQLDEEHIV